MANNNKSKTIRRFTNQVKLLRGLNRIPNRAQKPIGGADKDSQEKLRAFHEKDRFRADKQAIRFFAESYGFSSVTADK